MAQHFINANVVYVAVDREYASKSSAIRLRLADVADGALEKLETILSPEQLAPQHEGR